jgi:hypothetical protein
MRRRDAHRPRAPRATPLGGCHEADCVVALCGTHHRAYDQAGLNLVASLEPDWRVEVAHAVLHLGLAGALRRLGGRDAGTAEG